MVSFFSVLPDDYSSLSKPDFIAIYSDLTCAATCSKREGTSVFFHLQYLPCEELGSEKIHLSFSLIQPEKTTPIILFVGKPDREEKAAWYVEWRMWGAVF